VKYFFCCFPEDNFSEQRRSERRKEKEATEAIAAANHVGHVAVITCEYVKENQHAF
jgi:nitroimidazol reductase NimA-like FMN-containing flavoprotein (pyridoxamine 5'-phosphate oxidase superfamily)